MENTRKLNATVTPQQMKYMLRHKLASLLTQQQLQEKTRKPSETEQITKNYTQPHNKS